MTAEAVPANEVPPSRAVADRAAARMTAWDAAMTRSHGDGDYSILAPHSATRLRGASVRVVLAEREALLEELLRVRVRLALNDAGLTVDEIADRCADPDRVLAAVNGGQRFSTFHLALIADAAGTTVDELLRGAEPAPDPAQIRACTTSPETEDFGGLTVLADDFFDAAQQPASPPVPAAQEDVVGRLRQLMRRNRNRGRRADR